MTLNGSGRPLGKVGLGAGSPRFESQAEGYPTRRTAEKKFLDAQTIMAKEVCCIFGRLDSITQSYSDYEDEKHGRQVLAFALNTRYVMDHFAVYPPQQKAWTRLALLPTLFFQHALVDGRGDFALETIVLYLSYWWLYHSRVTRTYTYTSIMQAVILADLLQ